MSPAWIEGARPRTLPLSISAVIAGSAVALSAGAFHPWRALLALLVGVAMQLGVNFANDYSDGVRGTDNHRVGPQRLVASGAATPQAVKRAAFACFGIGCALGLWLVVLSHLWWVIVVGIAIVLAAWFYTGGKHPYGYAGWGDVSVMIFFGFVAAGGTVLVQTTFGPAWHLGTVLTVSLAQGAGACGVLVVNNLRDIETDRAAGKHTLAVRLGDRYSRVLFVTLEVVLLAGSIATAAMTTRLGLLCLAMLVYLVPAVAITARGTTGFPLVRALKYASLAQLVGAIGLFLGAWAAAVI